MNQEDQAPLISPDNLPPFSNFTPAVTRRQMKFEQHIHPRREEQLLRPNENRDKLKGFETVAKTIISQENQEDRELANTISDEKAIAIYKKLTQLAANSENKRIKRNWHSSETHLLYWVIKSYSKEQKIDYSDFSINDWEKISQFVPGRNANQCQYKWQSNHKPKNTKAPWTAQEDNALRKIIERKGAKSWADISRILNNQKVGPARQGKQCRQRWYNHVNPAIKWDSWTEWEDITLLKKQQNLGNKWSEIAKCIPGRTENSVKNRFNSLAKKERTKIQEQNKAKKKTSAENASDLKQSMNCFFKETVSEANNDIWINPLIERLKTAYFKKHQCQYDVNNPPDSDMQYIPKQQPEEEQPQKRIVIFKDDLISSSSESIEEADDSSDSDFQLGMRQRAKRRPPPRKKNFKEEDKLPEEIKIKNTKNTKNDKMTLRSHGKKEKSEPQIVVEEARENFKQSSSLSYCEQERSLGDMVKMGKISERFDSEFAGDDQFVLDQSLQEEFESKGRQIISELMPAANTHNERLKPIVEEPEGLEKRQMSRILRNMSLGNNPHFRYEEHFRCESSGLLPATPKIKREEQSISGLFQKLSHGRRPLDQVLRKIVLSKSFSFRSTTNPSLQLHLSNDAMYGDNGTQMFKLSNLEVLEIEEEKEREKNHGQMQN